MIKTRKAQELDIVELTEDLPQYGVKKGEQAVVITAFEEPDEAYDLEFVDESGTSSRFAYSVKPSQIKNTDEILKEAYEHAMSLLNKGRILEAEEAFKRVVELNPECLGNLHNSIIEFHKLAAEGIGGLGELESLLAGLRFVLRINSNFQVARHNMAAVYLNNGYQKAIQGDINAALNFYALAVGIESPPELLYCLKNNFASAYTMLSIQAQQNGDLERALQYSVKACEVNPDTVTRHNLGAAYANLGGRYLNKGDFQNAIRLLEYAQDTGLQAPQLFNNYGVAFAALGHIDRATKAFEKALEISPEDKTAENNLIAMGRVKMNLAKYDEMNTALADFTPISLDFIPGSPIQTYQAAA